MDALKHQFFDELRDKNTRLPNGNPLPPLFEFTNEEIKNSTTQDIEQLIPQWYLEKRKTLLKL